MKEVSYWDCFRETGSIQDYLCYRQENSVNSEKAERDAQNLMRQGEKTYAGCGHTDGHRTEG